jgi:hypothetical protein
MTGTHLRLLRERFGLRGGLLLGSLSVCSPGRLFPHGGGFWWGCSRGTAMFLFNDVPNMLASLDVFNLLVCQLRVTYREFGRFRSKPPGTAGCAGSLQDSRSETPCSHRDFRRVSFNRTAVLASQVSVHGNRIGEPGGKPNVFT